VPGRLRRGGAAPAAISCPGTGTRSPCGPARAAAPAARAGRRRRRRRPAAPHPAPRRRPAPQPAAALRRRRLPRAPAAAPHHFAQRPAAAGLRRRAARRRQARHPPRAAPLAHRRAIAHLPLLRARVRRSGRRPCAACQARRTRRRPPCRASCAAAAGLVGAVLVAHKAVFTKFVPVFTGLQQVLLSQKTLYRVHQQLRARDPASPAAARHCAAQIRLSQSLTQSRARRETDHRLGVWQACGATASAGARAAACRARGGAGGEAGAP